MDAHWKDGMLRDPTKVLSNPKIGKLFDPASVAIRTLARFGFTFDVVPVPSEKTKVTSDGVGLEMSTESDEYSLTPEDEEVLAVN